MKNPKLKNIVAEIKKMALPPPPPPIGDSGTVAPPAANPVGKPPIPSLTPANTTAPAAPRAYYGAPAVKEMQKAMQNLADAVLSDSQSQTMAFKPRDANQPHATQQKVVAKKGFNDFIAEQYLGTLDDDKKGVEWTTDKSVTTHPAKSQTQTDIYELDVVMDTLRRIGTGSKEFSDDGKWGFRTNNALKNIMSFAYALLELEGDFGLKNQDYNLANWKVLNTILSSYTVSDRGVNLSMEEQENKAEKIVKHLKAITKLYADFRRQVYSRPQFRPLLEGDRSFESYNNSGSDKDALSPDEDKLSQSANINVSGILIKAPSLPNGSTNTIPLNSLKSKEAFEDYLKSIGWTEENIDGGIAPKILKVIKQQLGAK